MEIRQLENLGIFNVLSYDDIKFYYNKELLQNNILIRELIIFEDEDGEELSHICSIIELLCYNKDDDAAMYQLFTDIRLGNLHSVNYVKTIYDIFTARSSMDDFLSSVGYLSTSSTSTDIQKTLGAKRDLFNYIRDEFKIVREVEDYSA